MSRLARLAAAHGVSCSYEPEPGRTAEVPHDTVVAVLAALGVDASTPRAVREAIEQHEQSAHRLLPSTVVLRSGPAAGAFPPLPALSALPGGTVLRVVTESGKNLAWGPGAGLPLGAHTLRAQAPDGRAAHAHLLVVPDQFPQPPGRTAHAPGRPARGAAPAGEAGGRSMGLLTQLYSLLSARSWGMGDLGDLADLAGWAGRTLDADFVQLGPLHSTVPGAPSDPSPYRPSTRRFPDPVHLRVEDVPEFARLRSAARARVPGLLARAAALRDGVLHQGAHIDRDAVWELKREALELVRQVPLGPGRRAALRDFLTEQGQALEDHATWCTFAELYGPDWRGWPTGLDDPRSARTAGVRAEHRDRVDFHRWLAWLTDDQLARAQRAAREAGMPLGLVHDMAVGVHPHGSDTWARQEAFAHGMSVGAPPDAFNAQGQDWGLPPWRPDTLAASGYAPYREMLAGLLRHAGALRIDHVLGHFRLWWVPRGRRPTEGTYVRYDAEAMLGALALEAHRVRAAVIGEDLGTVEAGVREELAARGVLGTSVLWFEKNYPAAARAADEPAPSASGTTGGEAGEGEPVPGEPQPLLPGDWRPGCLATAGTHDLPPVAARLSGEHVELRDRLGLLRGPLLAERSADAAETAAWLALFHRLGLLPPDGGGGESGTQAGTAAGTEAAYRFLARTPARLVGVWLPDAVGDRRPQNVPGTCAAYPNWRLPVTDHAGRPVSLEGLTASPRAEALFAAVREELDRNPGPAGRH